MDARRSRVRRSAGGLGERLFASSAERPTAATVVFTQVWSRGGGTAALTTGLKAHQFRCESLNVGSAAYMTLPRRARPRIPETQRIAPPLMCRDHTANWRSFPPVLAH